MADPIARLNAALSDRYLIERELGEGGMATVYLAEDLKHERKVALKVLKPDLAAVVGAERFLAEIKTTANLQHPHILPLFDSGEADSFVFYVMPYVEGETLRERIDREKQLPVDEAIRITTAVAHALDHAHRHGVIHRDIKPANILLQDGEPVVADFGIALAVGVAGGTRLTETGLSLGTPYYMSPEQATGDQPVGASTDTYALGCVLFEMLVGEPPYPGSTAQAVLGKIIAGKPVSATEQRPSIPANVDAALRGALEKLPADRFTSAQDFVRALQDPGFRHGEDSSRTAEAGAGAWKRSAVAMGAVAVILASMLTWTLSHSDPPAPVVRYGLAFPPGQEMVDELQLTFDIAPDGAWIVYVGPGAEGGQLWIKPRNRYEAVPLAGTAGARGPSVSPDGAWIAFTADGRLRKVPSGGGPAITLVDSVNTVVQPPVAWLDDGTLAYVDPMYNLSRVPWEGGPTETLLPLDSLVAIYATPLPGSRGLLVARCDLNCLSIQDVWVVDLRTGDARLLVTDATWSKYVTTGHVLYVRRDGVLFALPFDPGSLQATGAAVRLLDGVKIDAGIAPDIAVSQDGTLLMMAGSSVAEVIGQESEAIWVDREGGVTPVDPDWRFASAYNSGWALSPDGTRLAIGLAGEDGDDIWIKELDDGPLTRLTFHPARDARPIWTLDGRSVMFVSNSRREDEGVGDLYVKRADGTGPAELILADERSLWEVTRSSRGDWLVLRSGNVSGEMDIWGYRPGVDSASAPLLNAEFYDETTPVLSPDGRWLAYASDESGRFEVYVRPFPEVGSARSTVSSGGGASPRWANGSGELFYLTPDSVVSAVVETSPEFRVRERRSLFGIGPDFLRSPHHALFALSPDDQRFLMVRTARAQRPDRAEMILVLNWFEELKETVGN